jgi:hypothetical protein
MATRCRECHAVIHAPAALDALTMKCGYCGLEQPVPDATERQRLVIEREREARLRHEAEARDRLERDKLEREREKDQHERREKKRERRSRWLLAPFTLIPLLVGPAIIAVTVFDAPARLGCGATGGERIEQLVTQLAKQGCSVLRPIDSDYVDGTLSKLVEVKDEQCIRVIVAPGSGHRTLSVSLFASWSVPAVASVKDTAEPQLFYCATTPDTMRYEIAPGPASKGRLSHVVLTCPAPPPGKPRPKPRSH